MGSSGAGSRGSSELLPGARRRRSPRPSRRAARPPRHRGGCAARALRIGMEPVGARGAAFSSWRASRKRPVAVGAAARRSTDPSNTTVPPCGPAPGPMSTTWSAIRITSGSCSTTRTVLPLSRSRSSSEFDLLDVVGVEADRRLVEDVRHVRERRPEMADQPGPLGFAAGERPGRAIEAEVAQPDLHEPLEAVPEARQERPTRTARRGRRPSRRGR